MNICSFYFLTVNEWNDITDAFATSQDALIAKLQVHS